MLEVVGPVLQVAEIPEEARLQRRVADAADLDQQRLRLGPRGLEVAGVAQRGHRRLALAQRIDLRLLLGSGRGRRPERARIGAAAERHQRGGGGQLAQPVVEAGDAQLQQIGRLLAAHHRGLARLGAHRAPVGGIAIEALRHRAEGRLRVGQPGGGEGPLHLHAPGLIPDACQLRLGAAALARAQNAPRRERTRDQHHRASQRGQPPAPGAPGIAREALQQLAHRGGTQPGVRLQPGQERAPDPRGDRRRVDARARLQLRFSGSGERAEERLVQHRAEGEEIGARVGRASRPLLGREISSGRPLRAAIGAGLRQAEVGHPRTPVRGDQELRRAEVPVHDAGLVRSLQPAPRLDEKLEHLAPAARPLRQPGRQRPPALHQLHGDEDLLARLPRVVHPDDRGMGHAGQRPGLAQGARARRLRPRALSGLEREQLERHPPVELGIVSEIDAPRGPRAQLALDPIATDLRCHRLHLLPASSEGWGWERPTPRGAARKARSGSWRDRKTQPRTLPSPPSNSHLVT